MSARRLTALARVSVSPAQTWDQTLRPNKRTATTFSAQDVGGRDNQDKTSGPLSPHRSHENSKSRKPEAHSRVGTSGLGYGRNEAGATNRTASLDSTYLGQADDVHAMRSAYNNAQVKHLKYGTDAGVANPDSMAPPPERDLPRPDAASANAGVSNQMPPKNSFVAINQKSEGVIPQQHNSTALGQEYHLCKARIHATLWQQELRKQAGDLNGNADISVDSLLSTSHSRKSKDTSGWDINKTVPEYWETFNPPEGEFYDGSPAKEEALMFEEFEKRRERNRIQIASFVKQHLYGRRRPVDGWKYIINNFGTDNKAAKGSALGSRQTTGNDLEKLALKRESSRLRRKA